MTAVPLLAASVPVATLTGVLSGAMQGREQFLRINIVSVTSTALFQLFPLAIAWLLSTNLSLLLIGALGARIVAVGVMAYFCHQEITRNNPIKFDRREAITLLKYGGWVNLTSIFGPLLYMVDRFMIGSTLGPRGVTDYTVPVDIAARASILPSALMTALFPRLSSASDQERADLAKNATFTLISLLGVPFIAGIFIMGPFLELWVGDLLGDHSPWVGRVILISMWANAMAMISYVRLQASGRPDLVAKVLLMEILPYFGLLYVGVKLFGIPGCAIASVARSILDYVLLTWFADRRLIGWPFVLANLVVLSVAALLAGFWGPADWRWWASGATLCMISLAIGATTIPPNIKKILTERVRSLLPTR